MRDSITNYNVEETEHGRVVKSTQIKTDDRGTRLRVSVVDSEGNETNVIYAKGIFAMLLGIDIDDDRVRKDLLEDEAGHAAFLSCTRHPDLDALFVLKALIRTNELLEQTMAETALHGIAMLLEEDCDCPDCVGDDD